MSEGDDSGPAFPTEPNTQKGFYRHHGMSLRDWFAGQALVMMGPLLPVAKPHDGHPLDEKGVAEQAYIFADAMLAERKK